MYVRSALDGNKPNMDEKAPYYDRMLVLFFEIRTFRFDTGKRREEVSTCLHCDKDSDPRHLAMMQNNEVLQKVSFIAHKAKRFTWTVHAIVHPTQAHKPVFSAFSHLNLI